MTLSPKLKIFTVSMIALAGAVTIGGVASYNAFADAQKTFKAVPLPAQPVGVAYPTKEWVSAPIDAKTLQNVNQFADIAFGNKDEQIGETRALLIVKGGKIVYERYGNEYDKDSKLVSWSMAKSIVSAIVGIAIKDNKIKIEDAINDPHYRPDDPRRKITYKQALTMTDGINWRENDYADPINNDAALMLFGSGREDIVKYVTERKLKNQPGTVWNYSSGTSNLIAAGVSRSLGPRTISDPDGKEKFRTYIYKNLFHKIGMYDTAAEFDKAGNFYGSSFVYATARDYAKFGLLFLRDGIWDKERILPEGYVDFVRTPVVAKNAENYGGHWWLNQPGNKRTFKNSLEDAFMAEGHEGQLIVVIPSKDMVVVRLGQSTHEKNWDAIGDNLEKIINTIG